MVTVMVELARLGVMLARVLAYCTVKERLMLCADAEAAKGKVTLLKATPDLMALPEGSNTLKPNPGSVVTAREMS